MDLGSTSLMKKHPQLWHFKFFMCKYFNHGQFLAMKIISLKTEGEKSAACTLLQVSAFFFVCLGRFTYFYWKIKIPLKKMSLRGKNRQFRWWIQNHLSWEVSVLVLNVFKDSRLQVNHHSLGLRAVHFSNSYKNSLNFQQCYLIFIFYSFASFF